MNFLARLRAMDIIGLSAFHLSNRSRAATNVSRDQERQDFVGDIDGQTQRAVAFADELDKKLLAK